MEPVKIVLTTRECRALARSAWWAEIVAPMLAMIDKFSSRMALREANARLANHIQGRPKMGKVAGQTTVAIGRGCSQAVSAGHVPIGQEQMGS